MGLDSLLDCCEATACALNKFFKVTRLASRAELLGDWGVLGSLTGLVMEAELHKANDA